MANRDCIDYISLTMTALSVFAGTIAAWFSWKTWTRDKWRLEIILCQVDVERYGIGPNRIAYQFKVKNYGYRAVRVSNAFIVVGGQEVPLGRPYTNTKLDSGDEMDFNHVSDKWIDIDDVYLYDQEKKRWFTDKKHLREIMSSEKTRHL